MLFVLTGRAPGIGHLWGESELPSLPPELEAVMARARARDPSQRYASAGELARAALAAAQPGCMVVAARGPAQPAGHTRLRARARAPARAAARAGARAPGRVAALSSAASSRSPPGSCWGSRAWPARWSRATSRPPPTPTPTPSPTPTVVITPTPSPIPTPTEAPTETPTPEPTETPEPVSAEERRVERAIARHWRAIENGNYAARLRQLRAGAAVRQRPRALDRRHASATACEAVELEVEPEVTSDTRRDGQSRVPAHPGGPQRLQQLVGHLRAAQDRRRVADLRGGPRAPSVLSERQVRALHDDETLVVYQAYSPSIAEPALAAGTFVSPFKRERMTWIKPSFLWMMYRCGWATKWDPERSLTLQRLGHRAIQVGLSGEAVGRYVDEWITKIEDVTPLTHEIHGLVKARELEQATRLLPGEQPLALPADVAAVVGAD